MRFILLLILAAASVWDGITTVYGTILILGSGFIQIGVSLLFSALILGFLLNTKRIARWPKNLVGNLLKFFFVIAICYDFYTSWIANEALIIGVSRNASQTIILAGLTLMVISAPMLLLVWWERIKKSRSASKAEHPPESRRDDRRQSTDQIIQPR